MAGLENRKITKFSPETYTERNHILTAIQNQPKLCEVIFKLPFNINAQQEANYANATQWSNLEYPNKDVFIVIVDGQEYWMRLNDYEFLINFIVSVKEGKSLIFGYITGITIPVDPNEVQRYQFWVKIYV